MELIEMNPLRLSKEEPSETTQEPTSSPPAMQEELWHRLESWHPDNAGGSLPFSHRLQQENGWTKGYAESAIDEYRKFLFLSQVANHIVCPSEDVDQVWHQHLTYTRSYWEDLCGQVLKRPLHHQPTRGGQAETELYIDLYARTLASYEEWFGDPPDAQFWPKVADRFKPKEMQRVDRLKYLLIRRPTLTLSRLAELPAAIHFWLQEIPLLARVANVACFGLTMLLIPAAIPVSPLDWAGPDFLLWYIWMSIGATGTAFLLRHIMWPDDPDVPEDFGYIEVACLKGNWKLSVNAVLAKLLAAKHVIADVQGTKTQFSFTGADTTGTSDFENAVVESLRKAPGLTMTDLHHELQVPGEQLEQSLRQQGLLTSNASYALAPRFFSFLIMAMVAGFGLAKVNVGLSRGKPVGFLIAMLVVVCITAIWFFVRPRVTSGARRWLRQQKQEHAGLKDTAGADLRSPENIAIGTALFGVAALAGSQFLPLKTAWQANRGQFGSSGCGTAGCGGSGCGGGGGCGGCGGD
jgi:uncharacterized protein (TIGR04222 family)